MVGQASRLRVVQRPVRQRDRRPVHPGDRLQRDRAEWHAVPERRHPGPMTTPPPVQYDGYKVQAMLNGSTATTTAAPRRSVYAGDLRDELPDRLDGREAASQSEARDRRPGPDRRLPARARTTSRAAAAAARSTASTSSCSRMVDELQDRGLAELDGDHHHRQARPVAAGSRTRCARIDDGPIITRDQQRVGARLTPDARR